MRVSIHCDHCQHAFTVPESAIGKKGRCPSCKEVITASLPPAAAEAEPVEAEATALADEVPAAEPVAVEAKDEEPAPRPRKPRKVRPASQALLRFTVLVGGLVAATTAGIIFYQAIHGAAF